MTKDSHSSANQMLGTQLVSKSIASKLPSASGKQQVTTTIAKQTTPQKAATTNGLTVSSKSNGQATSNPTSPSYAGGKKSTSPLRTTSDCDKKKPAPAATNIKTNQATNSTATNSKDSSQKVALPTTPSQKDGIVNSTKLKSVLCKTQEVKSTDLKHHALEADCNQEYLSNHQGSSPNSHHVGDRGVSAKDLELLAKEAQDLKSKTRKLQLEVDEKNEIINVLKDELETLREQSDKYQRENIQLIKDAKRVKFLQDENDFLQDKVSQVEKLELEIKRLKDKLQEGEFFKIRITELEEDLSKAQEQSNQFEDNLRQAETKLTRVAELECELNKWKSFSHELEQEKNSIQSKLLESIDHEAKLDLVNKKVEDEVRRLRDLIKSYEEQRDEEQASNSFIMSVADLKQLDQQQETAGHDVIVSQVDVGTDPADAVALEHRGQQTDTSDTADSSCATDQIGPIKSAFDDDDNQNQRKLLDDENRLLKEELKKQEAKLNDLASNNKKIFTELDGNRKVISDLRQDLACEKSLTQKLTSQLTSFTKQIKSLDKQYFPMHDTSSSTAAAKATTINLNVSDKPPHQVPSSSSPSGLMATKTKSSRQLKTVTTIEHNNQVLGRQQLTNESNEKENLFTASELVVDATAARMTRMGAIELASEHGSIVAGDNGKSGSGGIDNETSKRRVESAEKSGAKLPSASNATKATASRITRTSAADQFVKCKKGEDDSQKLNAEKPDRHAAADLLKITVGQQQQQVAAGQTAAPGSSVILSSKSAASSGGCESRLALDESRRQPPTQKLLSTSAASNPKITGTNSSANEHVDEQHRRLGAQEATTKLADTLLSSMIDGGAKRKHGNFDGTKDNSSIHQSTSTTTKRVGCGGSTSSSLSPSSSARSQSSSPPSVAATLSHDSGFQSINHDFGQQTSPRAAATATASAGRSRVACTATQPPSASCDERPRKCPQIDSTQQHPVVANRSTPSLRQSPATTRDAERKSSNRFARVDSEVDDDESDELEDGLAKMPNGKSPATLKGGRSHFVRNALPSRSVNFGHSKSSAYLDRIRASVTATTTTTNSSALSFTNEHSSSVTNNITHALGDNTAPNPQRQQRPQCESHHGFVLNCMLDHQHSERCFAKIERPTHVQVSQPGVHKNAHQTAAAMFAHHPHQPYPHQDGASGHVAPSRQLSALIDPAAHGQLLVGMLQQQQRGGQQLTEQQIMHLNNLHRQHYYHHLHQLHQMHHQHHLYHMQQQQQQQQMQHKCPQTAGAHKHQMPDAEISGAATSAASDLYANCSGQSQFYAPRYHQEQVYANMAADNKANASRLVNQGADADVTPSRQAATAPAYPVSPQRLVQTTEGVYQHQMASSRGGSAHKKQLSQIDELTNGLPTVDQLNAAKAAAATERARRTSGTGASPTAPSQQVGPTQQQRHSPLSPSSPTSSRNSSNISPSSEASSTSSTNSLTTSGAAPALTRSALRHTTTQLGRRGFSVERDLADMSAAPQTATLSRVGSCRGRVPTTTMTTANQHAVYGNLSTGLAATPSGATNSTNHQSMLMRNPVKSQQPPMRTSKILNIAGSQQQQTNPSPSTTATDGDGAQWPKNPDGGLGRLANNLAHIKLSDNLAFSSLRAPKKSSSGSSLNTSLNLACQSAGTCGRISSTSSSPDKARLLRSTAAAKQHNDGNSTNSNNNNNNGGGGGKSSVWFEYGCI